MFDATICIFYRSSVSIDDSKMADDGEKFLILFILVIYVDHLYIVTLIKLDSLRIIHVTTYTLGMGPMTQLIYTVNKHQRPKVVDTDKSQQEAA